MTTGKTTKMNPKAIKKSPSSPIRKVAAPQQLNQFLSKTYHMVCSSDPSIVSWSDGGDCVIIHDVKLFSSRILPQYFKHRKFSSFVRQLNFYGFRKKRPDDCVLVHDEESESKCVRFCHEYFQSGHPELLHRIQRTTKLNTTAGVGIGTASSAAVVGQVESLKEEVTALKEQLQTITADMDKRMSNLQTALVGHYQQRITDLENVVRDIMLTLLAGRLGNGSGHGGGAASTLGVSSSHTSNSSMSSTHLAAGNVHQPNQLQQGASGSHHEPNPSTHQHQHHQQQQQQAFFQSKEGMIISPDFLRSYAPMNASLISMLSNRR